VVVSIDVKKNWQGKYFVYKKNGKTNTGLDLFNHCENMENLGVGEFFISSITNEGEMNGFDYELIKKVSSKINVPIIANGGAGSLKHFEQAILSGASALAAGSMFVFHGPHRGILINYLNRSDLDNLDFISKNGK